MRIISGEAKGRQVLYPPQFRARPTTNKVKEALFSILGPLHGDIFLDAYAGAGNVGIEALSRGAASAAFIEKDALLAQYVQKNLLQCGFTNRSQILRTTVEKAVSLLYDQGILFNIIFADPPYDEGLVSETVGHLTSVNIIAEGGIVILQHSSREVEALARTAGLKLFDQRKYGDTLLSFVKLS